MRAWRHNSGGIGFTVSLLLASLIGSSLAAEDAPGGPWEDATLHDVYFLDTDTGWAVGDLGVVWFTDNGGRTWKLQRAESGVQLRSVHFIDREHGWAVGGRVHPYTSRTSAVVLRTSNGGRRWTEVEGLTLPILTSVHFVGHQQGFAVGPATPMYPSGIFETRTGGRSWTARPGTARGAWLDADFSQPDSPVAVGTHAARRSASGGPTSGQALPQLKSQQSVLMLDAQRGWSVGDGGLLQSTGDGAATWQDRTADVVELVGRQADLTDLAAHGNQLWIVGNPGSFVLHSDDGGTTWKKQATRQSLGLRAVAFVDELHGWAAGDLGVVLATRDGGRSWFPQRAGGERLALLGVFDSLDQVPLPLFSLASAEEGHLSGVELLSRRDLEPGQPVQAWIGWQAAAALEVCGASQANMSWRFPNRDKRLSLPAERMIGVWDRLHPGGGLAAFEEYLIRLICQWRPDVVVIPGGRPSREEPLTYLLNQTMLRAIARAGGDGDWPHSMEKLGLRQWQVKKLFAEVPGSGAATVRISTSQLATRLGRSLADHASDASGYLGRLPTEPADTVALRLVSSQMRSNVAGQRVFSGLNLLPGGPARRNLEPPSSRDLDQLNRAAQKLRNLERLLAFAGRSGGNSTWLNQVDTLTQGLPRRQAGQLMFQLALQYEERGQVQLAVDAMEYFRTKYTTHPYREAAQLWLLRQYASTEMSWLRDRQAPQQKVVSVGASAPVAPGSIQPAVFEPETVAREVRQAGAQQMQADSQSRSWHERALEAAAAITREVPTLALDPRVRFPVAAVQRQRDFDEAQRLWQTLEGEGYAQEWSRLARAELWMTQQRGTCPLAMATASRAEERPVLDGQLDDPFWQDADPISLRSVYRDDAQWPATVLCRYDSEFLYLAAQCQLPPDVKYPPQTPRTGRDASFDEVDRVEWIFDVDRDYATYFRLAVDCRGWGYDATQSSTAWDPKWFIASTRDERAWSMEAAISFQELGLASPEPNTVWGFNVQRVAPRAGIQAFSYPASPSPQPSGFAWLQFE